MWPTICFQHHKNSASESLLSITPTNTHTLYWDSLHAVWVYREEYCFRRGKWMKCYTHLSSLSFGSSSRLLCVGLYVSSQASKENRHASKEVHLSLLPSSLHSQTLRELSFAGTSLLSTSFFRSLSSWLSITTWTFPIENNFVAICELLEWFLDSAMTPCWIWLRVGVERRNSTQIRRTSSHCRACLLKWSGVT